MFQWALVTTVSECSTHTHTPLQGSELFIRAAQLHLTLRLGPFDTDAYQTVFCRLPCLKQHWAYAGPDKRPPWQLVAHLGPWPHWTRHFTICEPVQIFRLCKQEKENRCKLPAVMTLTRYWWNFFERHDGRIQMLSRILADYQIWFVVTINCNATAGQMVASSHLLRLHACPACGFITNQSPKESGSRVQFIKDWLVLCQPSTIMKNHFCGVVVI